MSKPTEMDPRPAGAICHKINVTWGDCDPARIVYTGRLPWFALDAINGWWEVQLGGDGWFQLEVDRNLGTPFVRLEMDFAARSHPVIRCCAMFGQNIWERHPSPSASMVSKRGNGVFPAGRSMYLSRQTRLKNLPRPRICVKLS